VTKPPTTRPPGGLRQFIAEAGWTFAASMPEIPHEYTVRGRVVSGKQPPPVEWHDWFAEQIAEHGYQAKFAGRTFTYLEVDGWKYWSIRPIINRERMHEDPAA
jgi:hypothetical protein